MSRAERALKDAAKLYGADILSGLFALVFSAWLARNLRSAELSLWPVSISLGSILQALAGLAISDLLVRLVPSRLKDHQAAEAAALLRTGLAISCGAALVLTGVLVVGAKGVTSLLLHNEVDTALVRLLAAAVLFSTVYKHLERALGAVQEFGKVAAIQLFSQTAKPVLAVALYVLMGAEGVVVAL